jgi:hypothetical protein
VYFNREACLFLHSLCSWNSRAHTHTHTHTHAHTHKLPMHIYSHSMHTTLPCLLTPAHTRTQHKPKCCTHLSNHMDHTYKILTHSYKCALRLTHIEYKPLSVTCVHIHTHIHSSIACCTTHTKLNCFARI